MTTLFVCIPCGNGVGVDDPDITQDHIDRLTCYECTVDPNRVFKWQAEFLRANPQFRKLSKSH